MQFSSGFRKATAPSFMFITLRLFSYFRFIQVMACSCGSMHRGQREARVVRIPFCTES